MVSTHPHQAAMDGAVSYLITNYNPKGQWIGWLMLASILVEAWDLYSIAFVLIFMRDIFHPSPALLGLAAAGTQAAPSLARCSEDGWPISSAVVWCSCPPWVC